MAAGRNLNAKFILSLRDGVSAGLGQLKSRLDGLANNARRIGLMGVGVAALSFAGPIASAASYDTALRDLANTQGLSGVAAERFIATEGRRVELLARQYRMLSSELMAANNQIAASGLAEADRLALLPEVARLSVAERVAAEDAAKLAIALRQAAEVPLDQIGRVFAQITQGGRLGAVEIRDMANGFPALATAAAAMGMKGAQGIQQLVAALEIARRGAPDAATAMNNLRNVFQKMTSEETVKNFAAFNVDLPAVMRDASNKGISAMDALLEHVRRIAGNDPFKMSKLFADMQAVEGLRPIIQNLQAMLTMREQIAQADVGILDEGLAVRMASWASQMTAAQEASTQLSRRLGSGLAPSMELVNRGLFALVDGFDWMEERFPGVLGNVLGAVGGFTLLVGALGAAVPVVGFIATGIGLLAGSLGLVVIGAAAVAAVGVHVWRNWGTIGPKLARMWGDIGMVVAGAGRLLVAAFERGGDFLWGVVLGIADGFAWLWQQMKDGFNWVVGWIEGWSGGAMTGAINGIMAAWGVVKAFFNDLWDGVQARFQKFADYLSEVFAPLLRLIDAAKSGATTPQPGPAQGQVNARMAGRAQRIDGWDEPDAAVAGGGGAATAELRGRLLIDVAPGLRVREAGSDNPGVEFQGSRGQVLGRQ